MSHPEPADGLKVLFATAELRPVVSAGGLGEATAGLVRALRELGVDLEVVLPDYSGWDLVDEETFALDGPEWAQPLRARRGEFAGAGTITLIDGPGIAKPHPYIDPDGAGWPDNDLRFAAFSAAIAALCRRDRPDVLHLNDWHTGLTLGLLANPPPTVLTIHTLGYQGFTDASWLDRLLVNAHRYAWWGGSNPLGGAISLADRVVAVSPTYAKEILTPEMGAGLQDLLASRGEALIGIRNGIDTATWNPATDPDLAANYDARDRSGKAVCRAAVLAELGWSDTDEAIVGMVTRLVDQKGVDLALDVVPYLPGMSARLVLLGSGERELADRASALAAAQPDRVAFVEGYFPPLSHRLFGGADLLLMPSRFEPCGLAQMQAMAYGTIPVVTDVGGLHDTVTDADADRAAGTGFVAMTPDLAGIVDALHRALQARRHVGRRRGIISRGMRADWSWRQPATDFIALYRSLLP